ncbi:release factor glutamine methyltransferase [Spirochaetia bacterium]|nr:release factor glutamine methyltransferase [Spirochaetia bacterium]
MTIREALAQGSGLLKSSHIDTPALDAGLLLAEVLRISRAGLIAAGPDPLSEENYRSFRALLNRRLSGECVAYILGRREFRGLEFTVTPAVLVPRPDTETLVEAALGLIDQTAAEALSPLETSEPAVPRWRFLDLCTGSGAVAVSLKHERPELEVWASDISEAALDVARANAARLLGGRLLGTELISNSAAGTELKPGTELAINFIKSDLFSHINRRFNLIVSNPPYVSTGEIQALSPEVKQEPLLALDGGNDGLDIIRRLVAEAPAHLFPGGWLLLEADPRQMKVIAGLLETRGYKDILTLRDLSGQERVIGASVK